MSLTGKEEDTWSFSTFLDTKKFNYCQVMLKACYSVILLNRILLMTFSFIFLIILAYDKLSTEYCVYIYRRGKNT